ncbi:hypothetical protein [Candidatus Thiodictyon syntrophicum]|uniref:Uncharacterized protein n=1 Tax=Candidatus Thiodictyon syntrophicum TaxID=1166950 RepID=A0A2K8U6L2_9GAMM|nr:hypothetical protein [Candidatus Thiodictyon syntrophicum]AUB81230.1 hypothetical protein THSYN_09880 [Candidatus Thiodictyon syntrophicum]
MTDTKASQRLPPSRPTLLIGEGAFGADVLRRVLEHSALRGVLERRVSGPAGTNGRRRDLALALIDRGGPHAPSAADWGREGGSETLRDVFAQIDVLRPAAGDKPPVDRLAGIVNELMAVSANAGAQGTLPGLDLVAVARCDSLDTIGFLKLLFSELLDRLEPMEVFASGLGTGRRLGFILILDFTNYRADTGLGVREALGGFVEHWERRTAEGRLGCDRIYLSDGQTTAGVRDRQARADEASAFLELLLFEAQRGGDRLQPLFQADGRESPVATFGVRIADWNAVLLCRLAAACFAIQWLDHLAGNPDDSTAVEPAPLLEALDGFRPAALDGLVHAERFRGLADDELLALERRLRERDFRNRDWLRWAAERLEEELARVDGSIGKLADESLREIYRDHLTPLGQRIPAAVVAALHHPERPASLSAVIAAIEGAGTQLGAEPGSPRQASNQDQGRWSEALRALNARLAPLHKRYIHYRELRLEPEKMRRKGWWWMFAGLLTLGLLPIAIDFSRGYGVPPDLANILVVGPILWLLLAAAGQFLAQGRLASRVQRTELTFAHPQQGRLVAALRSLLGHRGEIRATVRGLVASATDELKLIVRSEATRELIRVLARLQERRRELHWLREQLRNFLRWQGVALDDRNLPSDYAPTSDEVTGIRRQHKRLKDLQTVLDLNPVGEGHFRTAQGEKEPFVDWDERYSDAFLNPFRFIADLSADYEARVRNRDSGLAEAEQRRRQAAEFIRDIADWTASGKFETAFTWRTQEGVPPLAQYCLMPGVWHQDPELRLYLIDQGLDEANILPGVDGSRAYLIKVLLGVKRGALGVGK